MDLKRPSRSRRKNLRAALYALADIVAVTFGLSCLKLAALSVARSAVLTDRPKRGQMLRQVYGIGTLIPEVLQQMTSTTQQSD
ncbi:MAG: hypothetical protein M3Q76_01475 [Acidobacteriota bacterium]|nr:hypothetical protein [Acidobacteriota bacterium]